LPCSRLERRLITADIDSDLFAPGRGFPAGGVFAAALDAVVVMDSDGRVRDWNPAAERVFGYSWSEAVGNELAELIVPPTGWHTAPRSHAIWRHASRTSWTDGWS
jgi:PAS domain-containing protein